MVVSKQLIIINGIDKTESVASFWFDGGKCNVVFKGSPKQYCYSRSNVRVLSLKGELDSNGVVPTINGEVIGNVVQILDFGAYYHFKRENQKGLTFEKIEISFQRNTLAEPNCKELFDYFKDTATKISLKTESGKNILKQQYDRIGQVSGNTVLDKYLTARQPDAFPIDFENLIFPFGMNQSQKKAVENTLNIFRQNCFA